MMTKRIIFGLLACTTLLAVSCEPSNTSEEDELYELSVEKSDISI